MSIGSEIPGAIDALVAAPVLVVGSPPPGGRDLDLLADATEYAAVAGWLASVGFWRRGATWARFDGVSSESVELSSFAAWFGTPKARAALFEDAEPVPGFRHLVRPGPGAVLLLAARGIVVRRGHLHDKSRARVAQALERDPHAWSTAERQAPGLGLLGAVRLLRLAYEAERQLSPSARAAGLARLWLSEGTLRAKGKVFFAIRRRKRRPAIVSFSGLDGAGKSTQVAQLRETLDGLGVKPAVQWARFSTAQRLLPIGSQLDRATAWGRRCSPGATAAPQLPDPLLPEGWRGDPLRQHAWAAAVTGYNLLRQWRHVLRRRPGAQVVLFDRFTPDAAVKLDYHYEHVRQIDIRWQRALFARMSPKPDVGFLLAVPPAVSYARVHEWEVDQLSAMSELYEKHARPYRLIRLDATEPREELARQIAVAVWRGLR